MREITSAILSDWTTWHTLKFIYIYGHILTNVMTVFASLTKFIPNPSQFWTGMSPRLYDGALFDKISKSNFSYYIHVSQHIAYPLLPAPLFSFFASLLCWIWWYIWKSWLLYQMSGIAIWVSNMVIAYMFWKPRLIQQCVGVYVFVQPHTKTKNTV